MRPRGSPGRRDSPITPWRSVSGRPASTCSITPPGERSSRTVDSRCPRGPPSRLRSLVTTNWLLFLSARRDPVIPIPVEVVGLHQDRRKLFVTDLETRRIGGRIQFDLDRQTSLGGRTS